jgi:FkbM family methyltransferase
MRLSYAQCLEDFHLELALGDRGSGFYIDVGAGHPVADNVSFHFYLKGWRGLVVEPQEDLARLYRSLRPRDTVIDYLVGKGDGVVPFHRVDRLHGFSTIVEENAKGAREFGAGYATEEKRIRPLSAVLAEHNAPHIDFLKIDVEGAEADVLNGMDWIKYRPSVLCIEAILPGSGKDAWQGWEPILLANDYLFAFFDGLNRFYVPKAEAALIARFPTSPTPWDAVKHYYELGQPHKREDHPDRALTDRLIKGFLASIGSMGNADIMALLERSAGAGGMETGDALRKLLVGTLDFPGIDNQDADEQGITDGFDDRIRAALGRIGAQYDGGMISEE